jgi:hypothetical protein
LDVPLADRFCRPQSAALEKMLAQAPLIHPLLPVGAVAVPKKQVARAPAATAALPAPSPPATPVVAPPAPAPVAVSFTATAVDAANVPITPPAAAAPVAA